MKSRPAKPPANPTGQPSASLRAPLIAAAILFVVTMLIYAQVWAFGFICIDDSAYVPQNPYVLQGVTRSGVEWSFTHVNDANWIPFTWISLMLDTNLYGGWPGGYHITNAVLHALNAVLLLLALTRATGNWARSAFVAALFALHPLHVESVAWVAERKDVLSTLFGLMSLWAYVRYATGGVRWNLPSAVLFLVASLLAKQTLVTLPFVFLLLDYWPLGRWRKADASPESAKPARRSRLAKRIVEKREQRSSPAWRRPALGLVAEKIPFFVASAVFCVVAIKAQRSAMLMVDFTFFERCLNAVTAYAAYLGKTIVPQNLSVYYPLSRENISWSAVELAAALLIAISGAALAWIRRYPFLFVGWSWYLGTLVPVIGLVQIGSQQMADRYTYFPLIGIFLAASWLVPELVPAGFLRERVLPIAAIAGVLLLATSTYSQITYWHDSITLLHHSLECTADSPAIHEFLGAADLAEGGDLNEAVSELKKTSELAPTYAPVRANLGLALLKLGRADEAAVQLREAIALGEDTADVRVNLARALFTRGQVDDAKAECEHALAMDADFIPAHFSLAIFCLATRDYACTVTHGERALELDPRMPECHVCVASALRMQGRIDEALAHLQEALALAPDNAVARDELAQTQAMKAQPARH